MGTPSLLQAAVSLPFLYVFFCIVGADPRVQATYYVGVPWRGIHVSRTGPDHTFSFFGFAPLFWTLCVLGTEQMNSTYCAIKPAKLLSHQTLFAVITVFLVGKILLGPTLESRKSLRIVGERKFIRPFSFMVYDTLMSIPMNFIVGINFKFIFAGLFAVALGAMVYLGIISESNSFISLALIIAWTLAALGRASGLMLTLQIPHMVMLFAYLGLILVLAFAWMHAEVLLRTCGVSPGFLPTYSSVLFGA